VNIPNLPTDNLYKFMALLGTVLVVLSVWFPMTRLLEVDQKLIDVDAEGKILDLDMKSLERESKDLEQEVKQLDHEKEELEQVVSYFEREMETFKKHPKPTTKDVAGAKNRLEEIKNKNLEHGQKRQEFNQKTRELAQKTLEIQKQHILLGAKGEQVKVLIQHSQDIRWLMYFGGIIGLLLMILGFFGWLWLVQIPQDQILRQQLQTQTQPSFARRAITPAASSTAKSAE
jgi:hypothetical protein